MNVRNETPWACHDCGEEQEVVTGSGGRSWYSNSGWYWVLLHPEGPPVYLDKGCFDSYDQDWPDYVGTHESSPWQGGSWEGKWLWVLPADYFERRDAYRALPRWERAGDGYKLVTRHNQTLGFIRAYSGDLRWRGMYQPLDADRNKLGDPQDYVPAKRTVEVHAGLTDLKAVQR